MYPGQVAEAHPNKPAFIMAESGFSMSFSELHDEAARLAQLFRSHGLKAGDHVAFCLENHPRFLSVAWGAHYAGLFYTAVSSRLTADEIAYIVNDCGARGYISSAKLASASAEVANNTPNVEFRICVDGETPGHIAFDEAIAAFAPEVPEDAEEGREMLYSSGTTGKPKGVKGPLPGQPLGTADVFYGLVTGLFGATEDSVYLSPAPLYHAAPLRFTMATQRAGATPIIMERFSAEAALAAIEEHSVTFAQFVPTMFVRMLKLPEEVRESFDLSSLECAVHAAAPCPQDVKRKIIDWWGPIVHEYYAGTEGNGFCYCNSEEWLAHPGTVGKSLLGPIHILDDAGNEVPLGETGGIYFESAVPFSYHNDEAKTKESYESHGWSTLGDIGYLDDDEYLHLTDRRAYTIISGGVNIYPQEAEDVLTMHPSVFDVAVFGIPDDDLGEIAIAVVQPSDDAAPGAALEGELIAYCQERLARQKCPRRIDFRSELPRHPTGKLYKRLLKDEYQ